MLQRPDIFTLNPHASLARGLRFAALGEHDGAKGYYHDSSLYKSSGSAFGTAVNWSRAMGRNGLQFTRANTTGGKSGLITNAYPFTLNCWVFPISNSVVSTVIAVTDPSAAYYHRLEMGTTTTGIHQYRFQGTPRSGAYQAISLSQWHHVTQVVTSAFLGELYLDGKLVNTETAGCGAGTTWSVVTVGHVGDSSPAYWGHMTVLDPMLHNRKLTLPEIQQLADPGNVMLSGLIVPPLRKWYPASTAAAFQPAWARNTNTLIGGGVG